ncbi:hypothetical protein ADK46_21715 [Streptomyces rimosus subsp. rimosus]|nr:hypothetical protein ADK46_21715 [Streptomyces rimosus subsp. rimosus]
MSAAHPWAGQPRVAGHFHLGRDRGVPACQLGQRSAPCVSRVQCGGSGSCDRAQQDRGEGDQRSGDPPVRPTDRTEHHEPRHHHRHHTDRCHRTAGPPQGQRRRTPGRERGPDQAKIDTFVLPRVGGTVGGGRGGVDGGAVGVVRASMVGVVRAGVSGVVGAV